MLYELTGEVTNLYNIELLDIQFVRKRRTTTKALKIDSVISCADKILLNHVFLYEKDSIHCLYYLCHTQTFNSSSWKLPLIISVLSKHG